MNQQIVRSAAALSCANELAPATWQMLIYRQSSGRLVLWEMAHSKYLVFRNPVYLRLQSFLVDPVFELMETTPESLHQSLPAGEPGDLVTVCIRSSGREFFLICESVAFYDAKAEA